jgi:pre-mRNA-splicing factor CWC22
MIEVMFQVRKDGFKDNKAVEMGLDVVEEEDQYTHLITLDEATDPQDLLSKLKSSVFFANSYEPISDVFKFDAEYETNEEKYAQLRKELLDESDGSGSDGDESGSGSEESDAGKFPARGFK